ncbi:MAG: NUDIX domain-containing protein [Patescibacteria group bacterium]
MQLILKLNPDNITDEVAANLKTRSAARGVVFDENNNVALLPVTAHHYYKLPGGGIEEGEDKVEAFRRECLEEIGSDVEVEQELGFIVEYRAEFSLVQTNFCYLAKTVGERRKAEFTQHELNSGFEEAIWIPLDKAIELMEVQTDNYGAKFIVERDTFLLKKVRLLLASGKDSP